MSTLGIIMLNVALHSALIFTCFAAATIEEKTPVGYILPEICPPIDRRRLFNDFLIWSVSSLPACLLLFIICRFAHGRLARPAAYRRYVDDQGDRVETCQLFTELEAIDPKENAPLEVHQARLRVHPSSRRKHRGKADMDLLSAMEAAMTARSKITKKRSKKRTSRHAPILTDEDEDVTQPSTLETLSKTQSFSPVSSEIYRSTVPSSVLPADSASNPATPTPHILADAIPTDAHVGQHRSMGSLPQFGHYGYIPNRPYQRGGPQTHYAPSKQSNRPTGAYGTYRHGGPNYMARLQDAVLTRTTRSTEPSVAAHLMTEATSNPDQRHIPNRTIYRGREMSRRRRGHDNKDEVPPRG